MQQLPLVSIEISGCRGSGYTPWGAGQGSATTLHSRYDIRLAPSLSQLPRPVLKPSRATLCGCAPVDCAALFKTSLPSLLPSRAYVCDNWRAKKQNNVINRKLITYNPHWLTITYSPHWFTNYSLTG